MAGKSVPWVVCAAFLLLVAAAGGGWYCYRLRHREPTHPPPTIRPAPAPREIQPGDPF